MSAHQPRQCTDPWHLGGNDPSCKARQGCSLPAPPCPVPARPQSTACMRRGGMAHVPCRAPGWGESASWPWMHACAPCSAGCLASTATPRTFTWPSPSAAARSCGRRASTHTPQPTTRGAGRPLPASGGCAIRSCGTAAAAPRRRRLVIVTMTMMTPPTAGKGRTVRRSGVVWVAHGPRRRQRVQMGAAAAEECAPPAPPVLVGPSGMMKQGPTWVTRVLCTMVVRSGRPGTALAIFIVA